MRRIIRITAIVVGVLAAIAIALVMLFPADVFRGPIEQAGSAATGRALNVRGSLRFTLYPELGISVSDRSAAGSGPHSHTNSMMRSRSRTIQSTFWRTYRIN
jgi:hypothetical protein